MSKDSEKKYEYRKPSTRYYDALTWRIPSVSSIPHPVDYVVQSPPFTFDGAAFILKMYPYGETECGSEGYINVILERLHSQTDDQNICVQMFCTGVVDKKVKNVGIDYRFTKYNTLLKTRKFMQNLKDSPEKERIAPNDIFTLVCAFRKSLKEQDCQTKSICVNVGERFRRSRNYGNQEIGEISKEYSHFKVFSFKICHLDSSLPAGYQIREQILFANAIWNVKIYPYFRMENSNRESFDMVLERLQTEIPEHHVFLEINMDWPYTHVMTAETSSFFNEHQTQGEVITFQLKGEAQNVECLHFDINMIIKKNTGLPKSSEQVTCCNSTSNDHVTLSDTKALRDFKELFLKQEDCDVVIKVQGQEFPAHRAILGARSLVFASTFRNDMKEKATGVVEIEDCDPSSFSDFLCFLYCGSVDNLTTENAFSLFTTADKYDVQDLGSQCLEIIKNNLSISTFCNAVTLALQYSEEELLQLSIDFLAKNLQEVIMTVEWQKLLIENPIQCNELMIKALRSNKVKE